jgi:Secretion system C-terminal sorting domain/FG-GAP-like repeat
MKWLFSFALLIGSIMLFPVCAYAQDWGMRTLQFNSTSVGSNDFSSVLDYDGDGLKDVIYGNSSRRELFLLRNQVSAPMQLEQLTDTLYGVIGLQGCNFNNDGLDDLVIGASTSQGDGLYVCVNQGNEQFQWLYLGYVTYEGIKTLVADDFDQDGDVDFVYDDWANSNIIWKITNNGDETFTQEFIEYEGQPTELFGVADLDADTDLDLVTAYWNFGSGSFILVVQENIGSMDFASHEGPILVGANSGKLGDFVGDDLVDLVVTSNTNPGAFYENTGNFEFVLSNVNPNLTAYSWVGPVLDWDDNGLDEFFYMDGNDLIRVAHHANNTFTSSIVSDNNAGGNILAMEDFNLDGIEDVVTNYIELFVASGDQYDKVFSSYLNASTRVCLLDSDSEGKLDVICGGSGGQVSIFDQTFNELMAYPVDFYLTGASISATTAIKEILPFDKDNDGDEDMLCLVSTNIYWMVNDNGNFTQQIVSDDVNGYAPWVGDLDNDGMHDILVYDSPFKRLEWNGVTYVTTELSWNISDSYGVLDVDGDGDKDILFFYWNIDDQVYELRYMKNNNNNFVDTYLSNVTDNFPIEFNLSGEGQFSVRDLDQDGDEDWVFASGETSFTDDSDFLAWYRNEGSGIFVPFLITDEVGQFRSFDLGDLDLDGDLDLVSSAGEDYGLMLHRNDGSNVFTAEALPFETSAPLDVLVRDMDGDLDLDVVFGSAYDHRLGWLVNLTYDCERRYSMNNMALCEGDSLWVNGQWAFESGWHADTLTAINGCDSIHISNLTVIDLPAIQIVRQVNNLSVTQTFENYAWYFEGTLISSDVFVDAGDFGLGTYSFYGTTAEGCTLQVTSYNVNNLIGVDHKDLGLWWIGPNPTFGSCNVNAAGEGSIELTIWDSHGRKVRQNKQNGGLSVLDLSDLATGMYAVHVQGGSGAAVVFHIQKM